MPQFEPGEEGVAIATFPTKPAGLSCTAELWLASDMTKVATSGEIPFTATGGDKSVTLPITLPGVEGTYAVYLEVFSNGQCIATYQALEDVVIVAPVALPFSFGAPLGSNYGCGGGFEGYTMTCVISNPHSTTITHRIKFKEKRHSRLYDTWETRIGADFSLTLQPGESYTFDLDNFRDNPCLPFVPMRYDVYLYLEDELGNQSEQYQFST